MTDESLMNINFPLKFYWLGFLRHICISSTQLKLRFTFSISSGEYLQLIKFPKIIKNKGIKYNHLLGITKIKVKCKLKDGLRNIKVNSNLIFLLKFRMNFWTLLTIIILSYSLMWIYGQCGPKCWKNVVIFIIWLIIKIL